MNAEDYPANDPKACELKHHHVPLKPGCETISRVYHQNTVGFFFSTSGAFAVFEIKIQSNEFVRTKFVNNMCKFAGLVEMSTKRSSIYSAVPL